MRFTIRVESPFGGASDALVDDARENIQGRIVEAPDQDVAWEEADRLLGEWVGQVMAKYEGPQGTEPTGIDGIVAEVHPIH